MINIMIMTSCQHCVLLVQILVIQLADDCAESIGLLDADLAADSLPDYLTAASVHVSPPPKAVANACMRSTVPLAIGSRFRLE